MARREALETTSTAAPQEHGVSTPPGANDDKEGEQSATLPQLIVFETDRRETKVDMFRSAAESGSATMTMPWTKEELASPGGDPGLFGQGSSDFLGETPSSLGEAL